MSTVIRAITFDLDDTLWPFAPIGERIETALHAWFREHSPQTAERFPIHEMRALRERVFAEFPEHAHDLGPVSYTHLDVYKRQLPHGCAVTTLPNSERT